MPATSLVTVPNPVPAGRIVRVYCGGGAGSNSAVTFWAELMVTLQAPVPVQAPLQPPNTEPDAGDAARLTNVPEL